jgi:alkanesulfonate monooxygenase SsuD/methylene tetrahydromethanopterin reductase-like flavin-dependent oxidoreductase (luciferase family)
MQKHTLILTAEEARALPDRERVGLALARLGSTGLLKAIRSAEEEGVRQIWSTQGAFVPDTLTIFAAAAMQTSTIRLGTAIIPTYPRHPLTMVAQALALNDLAPGRLRLGLGSSHQPTIEGVYGLKLLKPLDYLREYVSVVRSALWDGQVDFQGQFFTVKGAMSKTAPLPILTSVLRVNAFKLAGEITDGALSWLCPVPYLLKTGLPALRASAEEHGRPAPPLVAHVLVAASEDRPAVLQATRAQIKGYGRLPFYAAMFADAGHPVSDDGSMTDDLIRSLVISGNSSAIATRLKELLSEGLDELLVLPVPVQQADQELQQLMQVIGSL